MRWWFVLHSIIISLDGEKIVRPLIPDIKSNSPSVKKVFSLNQKDEDLYSIKTYEELAKRYIRVNAGPLTRILLNDDDAVSYIMYKLMVGTCHWNHKWKHIYIKEKYLWYIGRYAVIKLINLYGKNKLSHIWSLNSNSLLELISHHKNITILDKEYEDENEIEEHFTNAIKINQSLSNTQRKYLLCICGGLNQSQTAVKFGVSRQAVNDGVIKGRRKMTEDMTNMC